LMQKASVVPIGRPFRSRLSMIGIMPVTLEYKGMPTNTAEGTVHHWPVPRETLILLCGRTFNPSGTTL
ncbi:hypothetical protein AAIH16_35365, partial [Pseudomonas aeruginosa]